MTRVGIVGAEAAKFSVEGQWLARCAIREVLEAEHASLVVSGHCHLGGIDIWAIEEAEALGIPTQEYPPKRLSWELGYKPRNLQIVRASDLVVSITVQRLPEGFKSRWVFPQGCYHCKTPPEHHVKSGGCWTLKQAARAGRRTRLIVVPVPPGETPDTASEPGSEHTQAALL